MTWKITKHTDPWTYIVIDNFFERDDLEVVRNDLIGLSDTVSESPDMFGDAVSMVGREWKYVAETKRDSMWLDYHITIAPYMERLNEEFLLEHFPNHRLYDQIKFMSSTQIVQAGMKYPTHVDAARKVMSTVVYIAGNGRGTYIHDHNGNVVREIEWKINRAVVFAPLDGVTWHSYEADGMTNRTTLLHNIVRIGNRPD